MRARSTLALALAACGLAAGTLAHVRLYNPVGGQKLFWKNPGSLAITVDPVGSDDIADDSETTAVRLAMQAWNEDPGSAAQLADGSFEVQDACQDWLDTSSQIVFFDESNCSGFFGGGSGAVAVTPIWFNNKGTILDADVIFNGQGFSFSTDGAPGSFDVQDVATHELGHLLGLDHSGWAGSTMYPYVDEGLVLQRSLSQDDVNGLRDIAPALVHTRLVGRIRRVADSSPVAGAHVVAVDVGGRTAGGTLTADDGSFDLRGLDAGDYTVFAAPLEGPVSSANLQSGRTIETDFEPGADVPVTLAAGQALALGDLLVEDDVAILLGTPFDELPVHAQAGSVQPITLTGSGLVAGSTLTASDPAVTVSGAVWLGGSVAFTLSVPSLTPPGHVDLSATDPLGARSVLVAAIEVAPPPPTVSSVSPGKGNDIGGTAVTVSGTGFRAGARVVVGESIYHDGQGGCEVVDASTITLSTLPSSSGTHDVVVIDPAGVEGRLDSGFTVASIPVVQARFPAAGTATGGTELVLTGQNFQPGMQVRIDSVLQPVTLEGTTTARVTTVGGAAGGPYVLEAENPSGEVSTLAFSYVAQADPVLQVLTPASGSPSGGKQITVTGAGFTAASTVHFGVDPLTGTGGTQAAAVIFVDANTLLVTTPAMSKGRVAVMVQEPSGQASILPDAYSYKSSGGGGGGGCHVAPLDGPRPDPRLGAAWMLLAATAALAHAHLARRRHEQAARLRAAARAG